MDRSARSLLTVSALVLAVLFTMNYSVQESPLVDWWPVLALLLLALAVWVSGRYSDRQPASVSTPTVYVPPPVVREPPAPQPEPPAPKAAPKAVPPKPAPKAAAPAPAPKAAAEAVPAKSATKAAAKPDDLTVIEGIGPKMSAALVAAGIDTYARLAQTSEEALHAAVEAAGMRLAPSIPTWAQQAAFAAKGDMDGLKAFQSTLKGRRKK
jgi:predicted flap endonuclease-1-like 5' DNA nuclease